MGAIRTLKKAAKTLKTVKRVRTVTRGAKNLKASAAAAIRRPKRGESPAKAKAAVQTGVSTLKTACRIFGAAVLFRMAKACLRTLK